MISSGFIEKFKHLETPFYFYDLDLLRDTLDILSEVNEKYGYHIHYALKANNYEPILKTIKEYELGADCVSGNEVIKAINLGFPSNKIAFAGVGKTDKEIVAGLENNIFSFNCESIPEIEVIDNIAGQIGKVAPIAIRINPDIDPKTHRFITTGLKDSKFGINHWDFEKVAQKLGKLKNIRMEGIHFHIGSQISDMNVFRQLSEKINVIQNWFYVNGFNLSYINAGGGLGIDYNNPENNLIPDFEAYFKTFYNHLELNPGQELHLELGRSLVGQCGFLIVRALYLKKSLSTEFLIIDGGMNDLIRPMLYHADHKIIALESDRPDKKYDVVGPVCESTDVFSKGIFLSEVKRGELLAVCSTGAYGQVMASEYNMRTLVRAFDSDSIYEE